MFCSWHGFPGCFKCNSSKTNWDVPELFSIPPPSPPSPPSTKQLEDVHAPFVFEILLICFNDIDCIDYYLFQKKKKLEKKCYPRPSTWYPRPRQKDRLRADCFFERSHFLYHTHVISLLLIFADTCRTTELYIFHLGYFQISMGYIICKFQFLYIFVANY